ncbi:aspartyl-phosphate phosphatase Spo0E family protein (plasmid) [Priestia aryabhattai]|nr:aspartyl-phosphate phosphatase Spo0E family protein [Priestia megaterium]MBK0295430.1 aspartyl-phosphate phosphatase Spo0E family protein [Bacillus sp. S34]MBY0214589.1 aspartyl-phosphate phosphatase Spo0E family protein [Priestia aryabhattai]NGY85563.1 aspartyl-phosphate phosphatase Spo0E family protein [Priestia megaterium]PEI54690.1 Spo0E family sporulation regulatory protein-aspartic acid phosphatase [Priestia aryabhattai]PHF64356.1 Spo0E family sporulation regulatory protein-aspartic a
MGGYKILIKQRLITEIEVMRERMIVTALEEGMDSHNTIRMSKLLDQLLNELDKLDK